MMAFELARVFEWSDGIKWGLIAVLTIGYGLWSRSAGKPLFIVMILVMIPLAITELGTDSWITEILLTPESVWAIMRGGRARWKIENETFNTLKNQGYHLEHNYGHGEKNLSVVLALVMMLAFPVD